MDLEDRDILQINATIIAEALIFLTFINFGERTGTSHDIATTILKDIVSLAIA
jgi:hypothetical protein